MLTLLFLLETGQPLLLLGLAVFELIVSALPLRVLLQPFGQKLNREGGLLPVGFGQALAQDARELFVHDCLQRVIHRLRF